MQWWVMRCIYPCNWDVVSTGHLPWTFKIIVKNYLHFRIFIWENSEITNGSVSFKKWPFWWNKLSESGNAAVQMKRASLHHQCVSMYIIFTETPSFVLRHFWTISVKDEQICTDFTAKGQKSKKGLVSKWNTLKCLCSIVYDYFLEQNLYINNIFSMLLCTTMPTCQYPHLQSIKLNATNPNKNRYPVTWCGSLNHPKLYVCKLFIGSKQPALNYEGHHGRLLYSCFIRVDGPKDALNDISTICLFLYPVVL